MSLMTVLYAAWENDPMGGAGTSRDPQTYKVTDTYAEYKCDNCGNPGDVKGRAKPVNGNADV